jgi:TM2 domain-containing membrane protein YozV
MNLLDILAVMSGVHDLTLEYSMLEDHAGFLAILLFMGGLLFWFILLVGAVVGVCRGIKRLWDTVRDMLTKVHPDLEMARRPAK